MSDQERNPIEEAARQKLSRRLTLPLLVLYGLGVTIGAGIYVLIGATAGRAGIHAPLAFLLAAAVMGPTCASFAELTCRLPVSAGEAAFVKRGFQSNLLSVIVGLMVISVGSISAAAIAVGSAGYIRVFFVLSTEMIAFLVILAMGAVAIWGILESVSFAAVMTAIEIAGLLLIIAGGFFFEPQIVSRLPEIVPQSFELAPWIGIFSAGLLAFFAFVGFEDLVNVAEEVKNPKKTMPSAIFLTLGISTLIYFLVVSVAVLTLPASELARSEAPLTLVFEKVTPMPPVIITLVAIIATLNGIIVQIIMASRVLYGLSAQGNLPEWFGRINSTTRTPLNASFVIIAFIAGLAVTFPLTGLAETTSAITLAVFTIVNLALIRIRKSEDSAPPDIFMVPIWVPWTGLFTCLLFLIGSIIA